METLRTSEIGKRLKEEWPDRYTKFQFEIGSYGDSAPKLYLNLYHEDVSWVSAPTFEECIEKVKAALAPKPPPPDDTEVVIDTEVRDGSD